MSNKYLVKEESLSSVADAIREKTNTSGPMLFPSEFISNIESIISAGDDIVAAINASDALIDDDNLSVRVRDAVAKTHEVHTIATVTGLQDALDLKETVTGATTKASTAESNAKTYADGLITDLLGSAPATLDTLNELAEALGNDPNFAATITNNLATKANKTEVNNSLELKADITYVDSQDALKADKTYVDNKVKTDVPVGAKFTDTVYSHPASHPASMITGLPTSLPANGGNADTVGGFTVGTDVPSGAKFTDTITTINGKTGTIAKADITALGIPAQDTVVDISGKADITYVDNKVKTDVPVDAKFTDTVYAHPASHPASMITESSTKRFVSDSEKSTWNSKSDTDTVTTINGKTGAISKADIVALGIPSQDTNTTYSEITTAEIDTGTASTLKTITGRRVKHILDKVQGWISGLTKSDVGLSNVDNVKQMPISGGVLEDYREKRVLVNSSGGSISLSLGNVFVQSPNMNITYSITNAISEQAHSFTLIINMDSTVRTLTFPSSIKWQGGEIPDLSTPNKTYVLTFMSVDGGTNWLGMFGGEF